MEPIVVIQSIRNDFIASIYDLIDELKFLRHDIEKLKENKGDIDMDLIHIEAIGTDLKLAVDDIINEIKLLRKDVDKLKQKKELVKISE